MVAYSFLKSTAQAFVAATVLAVAAPASAAIISVETSASGGGSQGQLIFNNCTTGGTMVGSGELLGCLNGAPTSLVKLSSQGDSLTFSGGGQARIEAADGTFDDLTIDLLGGGFFEQLVLNIMTTTAGTVDFGDGFVFGLSGNGNNFFTLAFDGMTDSFSFSTTADIITDVRQVRITQGDGGNVPVAEPAALGLLGLGIAALALRRRSRTKA